MSLLRTSCLNRATCPPRATCPARPALASAHHHSASLVLSRVAHSACAVALPARPHPHRASSCMSPFRAGRPARAARSCTSAPTVAFAPLRSPYSPAPPCRPRPSRAPPTLPVPSTPPAHSALPPACVCPTPILLKMSGKQAHLTWRKQKIAHELVVWLRSYAICVRGAHIPSPAKQLRRCL